MRFTFAGMDEAQDQAAMTDLLVKQVQSGLISIDEAREELQRTAWGLDETSGPLVFTQMGPVPLNQVIDMMTADAADADRPERRGELGQRGHRLATSRAPCTTRRRRARSARTTPAPASPPARGCAPASRQARVPRPTLPRTRRHAATRRPGRRPSKAVRAELDALARHLRKGRDIATWIPEHLSGVVMATVAEDLTKGIGIDEAVRGGVTVALGREAYEWADEVV